MWLGLRYFKGFYMSLGMFCGIPLPFHVWNEKYVPLMVASVPLVGVVIGSIWWLAGIVAIGLELPHSITAAILTLAPFFIAGFIHLDGYMDTSDALLSCRSFKERQRILKDPLVGSFAVVMLGILFLAQFAAMYAIAGHGQYLGLVISISVISRSCSAFSIFVLRHSPQSNYTSMLSQNIGMSNKLFVLIVAIVATRFSYLYAGFLGTAVSVAVILGYIGAMRRVFKSFDGISGDLLGYSMVIGELCGLLTFAVLHNAGW